MHKFTGYQGTVHGLDGEEVDALRKVREFDLVLLTPDMAVYQGGSVKVGEGDLANDLTGFDL